MARPKKEKSEMLTELELEVMKVLWEAAPCSVHEVLEFLKEKKYAYTTVSTVLRILEKKGFVESRKQGRGHLYSPCVEKEAYQVKTIDHVLESVFDGTPVGLVKGLIGNQRLTPEELKEIKKMLDGGSGDD